jgi:hypothetical protein
VSSYWETPARFNPALAYQHQALLNFLLQMQTRNNMLTGPQPSWHTPDLVSVQQLIQGLQPTKPPQRFLGPPIRFEPPPPQNTGFLGPPVPVTTPPVGGGYLGPPQQQQAAPPAQGGPRFLGPPTQIGPTLPNLPTMKGY